VDIEWEDLQQAFLSTRTDREYYLDRDSGEVISISESEDEEDEGFEAGNEQDGEEDAGESDEERLREEMESEPDRFCQITPVPMSDRVEWMASFTQTVKVKELLGPLNKAVNGEHPDRDFDRALRKDPAERARWLGFLEGQVQEIIEGWTEENDIESETPPPWKVKVVRRRSQKKAES